MQNVCTTPSPASSVRDAEPGAYGPAPPQQKSAQIATWHAAVRYVPSTCTCRAELDPERENILRAPVWLEDPCRGCHDTVVTTVAALWEHTTQQDDL